MRSACQGGHALVLCELLQHRGEGMQLDVGQLLLHAPLCEVRAQLGEDMPALGAAGVEDTVRHVLLGQLRRQTRFFGRGDLDGGAAGLFDEVEESRLLQHEYVTSGMSSAWGREVHGEVVWRFMAALVRLAALPASGLHGLRGALRAACKKHGVQWVNGGTYDVPEQVRSPVQLPMLQLSIVIRLALEAVWRGLRGGVEGAATIRGVGIFGRLGRRHMLLHRAASRGAVHAQ